MIQNQNKDTDGWVSSCGWDFAKSLKSGWPRNVNYRCPQQPFRWRDGRDVRADPPSAVADAGHRKSQFKEESLIPRLSSGTLPEEIGVKGRKTNVGYWSFN